MTTHSSDNKRLLKSKNRILRRRQSPVMAGPRQKTRALRLEPLELRTLLSADVFEAVLGGPTLLSGANDETLEPAAALSAGELNTQGSVVGAEGEFPDAFPLCYDYEYVIITSSALKSSFQPLLEQKQSRGLTGRIVTTEYIYAYYGGTESGDDPDKIRDFITFIHGDWGTEWVLLGGDVEIVPQRGVYAEYGGQLHHDLPTDLYYACLDGPWDGDSDGIWGETNDGVAGGDIDLVPEVYIGRAPVSNTAEATNFVNKTVLYETTAHPNHNTAIWLGEQIDATTWGAYSSQEIRDEVLPDSLNLIEHYELEGPWTGSQLQDELNNSPHFVNNLSHASEIYDSKLTLSMVAELTNPFPYLIYSQGCDAGSFDTMDVSIAEQHVVAEHGAFAAIMNSRDGWYIPGTDPGASHQFAFSFWNAVFNEGKVHLGEANQAAKLENLWRVGVCGYARWVYMQTNLLGDPETPLQLNGLPDANDDIIQLIEGATSTLLAGGSSSLLDNDADLDLPQDTLTVNTTPVSNVSHGTLTLHPDGTFSYTHDGSENLSDSFVYEVSDSTGNQDSATVTITVSGVNDVPVLTVPQSQSVDEDTLFVITGIGVSDSDAADGPVQIMMSVANGRITLAQTGGLTFVQGTGTGDAAMTFTGTVADVSAALASVNYLGNANYNGPDTLNISVDDLGNNGSGGAQTDSAAMAITVLAVNDAPVVTVPAAGSVIEDDTTSITGISIFDLDAATGSVSVTASVSHGQITLAQTTGLSFTTGDGTHDSSMTFTGTLASVNAALGTVNYAGNTDYFGADTLNISVNDQGNSGSGGAKSDSDTVTITVSGVNDAPVLTLPPEQRTNVSTAVGITGIDIADADAGSSSLQVTVSAARGRLTLATTAGLGFTEGDGTGDAAMTISGTRSALNAALSTLTYDPDVGYEGYDIVELQVSDLGNAGAGGPLVASGSIRVQVGVVADLIAWWTFDETGGTVAADTSPFGATHDASLQGNAQWNPLGLNGDLQLDGNGDGVALPNSNDFNLSTISARTVSGWFFVADKTVNSRSQLIFEEGGDTRGLSVYVRDGRLYVGGWNTPSNESNWSGTFLGTDQIQSGRWHHVALVLNGSSTVTSDALRGYLDGVEFASGPGSQLWAHTAASAIGQAAAGVRFHSGFESGGNGFEGMLDDVRVYNRALTVSEVAALASATLAEPQALTVSIPADSVPENGSAITGTLSRAGNLGSALVVTLTSSDPGRLTVPPTVTFTAGQSASSFQLTPQDNAVADGAATIVITATAAGSDSGQDTLTVIDDDLSDAGLVAYWAMNEGSGSTAADTSPYGHDHTGTLAGDTTWSSQGLGYSLQFDGDGDRLAVPTTSSINIAWVTQRTVSLWFAVDDASLSSHKQLLYEEGGSTRGINIYLDSGRLYVGGWNAPHESNWTGTFLSTDQIQSGQWHHVALVLNGGTTIQPNVLKAYLDGVEYGSGSGSQLWTHSDGIGVGQVIQTTKFHDGDAGGGYNYAGLMDELRVYQRALGAGEIQTLASQSMAAQQSLTVSIVADSMSEQSGSTQGTVTRSGDTGSALVVTLNSSDASEATVPATVMIGVGQSSATFTVTAQDDMVLDRDSSVSITAAATDMASGSDSVLVTDNEEVLVNGVVTNVANSWTTVTLPQDYMSMVVVATPNYTESHIPVVARVRNATGNSFELRVDRTDGAATAVSGVSVHYVVAEEGVYTPAQDGVAMEAVKYSSTVTDRRGNWVGESRSYAQSYQSPVVLGQVQTYNDPDFSVFWSRGAAASDPASSSVLRVGKHVGEDTDTSRAAEIVGYLVLEAGTATAGSATFTAGVGAATIEGMDDAPPYSYSLSGLSAASVAVAGLAGMYGDQGGWAVLYGADPVNATRLQLAADEDQAVDAERVHVGENVSYLVFEDSALRLQGTTGSTRDAGTRDTVTLEAVQSLLSQAIALWDADSADASLDQLQVQVRDLPQNELARVDAADAALLVDINAAGQGWFVDPTPAEREEFSYLAADGLWAALEHGPAAERVDLLSVLAHELGHLLGHGHQHEEPGGVMSSTLQAGARRLPQLNSAEQHYQAAVDQALADKAIGDRFDLTRLLASAQTVRPSTSPMA